MKIKFFLSPAVARRILKDTYSVDPKERLQKQNFTPTELEEVNDLLDIVRAE